MHCMFQALLRRDQDVKLTHYADHVLLLRDAGTPIL